MNSPSQRSNSFRLQQVAFVKLRICRAFTGVDLRSADNGYGAFAGSVHEAGHHTEEELPCNRDSAT
jgi:hypothetical protein